MPLLTEVFKANKRTFSFEVFPAKTPEGHSKLLETIQGLCVLKPDFISCGRSIFERKNQSWGRFCYHTIVF